MGIFSRSGIIKSEGAARSVRQTGLEERAADASVKAARNKVSPQSAEASDILEDRQFFSTQVMQTAYVRLKTRLPEVGAKFDAEMYVAGLVIAMSYVQTKSLVFSDFVRFMLASFGDSVKPHLLSFYAGVSHAPDFVLTGMTSYEQCLREYATLMSGGLL